MMGSSQNNKRIAKNTALLYIRSLVIMLVGVYTSRIVLDALGVDNYGIYNIVGGFVSMFSILSSSLISASQRFISYEMGRKNPQMEKIFTSTFTIHLILAFVLFLLFETIGLWFLNNKLNISQERLSSANWVFQCSVLTFCINIVNIPCNATIIAHEKMSAFAYISIYEVFAKLLICYLLYISSFDRLKVYSILLMLVAVSMRFIYNRYCHRHFSECKFYIKYDNELFKKLLSFSGWNFIGTTAGILTNQGVNVLINIFFGVTLNAARGIAEHLNYTINSFVTNFMTAMNPQITKSYASGDYEYMNKLMIRGAKYASLLYWSVSIILFIQTEYILNLWLVKVPVYAPLFLRFAIIYSLFQSLSHTLYIGMLATGNIRKYQIIMGTIYISSFGLCYVFYAMGLGPEYGYISSIIAVFIGLFARLWLLGEMIPLFSSKEYFLSAVMKVLPVIIISSGCCYLLNTFIVIKPFLLFVLDLFVSFITVVVLAYFISLDNFERNLIKKQYKKIFERNTYR